MPSTSTDYARFVIISANVESLLKEPGKISAWTQAVGKEVAEQKPVFAAIHLQGVKSSSDDVIDQLTRDLDSQPGFELFTHSRHFHDPNKLVMIYLSKVYISRIIM
uniref:Uncharacterized protein n=1 Tax=Romanomermis culicivorax TaxID=13658 RepID=A0A915IU18_ROMCU